MKKKESGSFDRHPGLDWGQAVIDSLEARTGKTLEAWVRLLKQQKLADKAARIAWLRSEHGLGIPTATAIAMQAAGESLLDYRPDDYIEKMFSGKKAALRPIYEALLTLGRGLGSDVQITPTETTVPLRRRYVFANIKPTTNTRVDLGLALKETKATGRLIDTGGLAKGDRITHRIALSSVEEVDAEVATWLQRAYDMDAPK